MKIMGIFLGVVGFAALACPAPGWSQSADVFPSFGAEKDVVSEVGDDFRGSAAPSGCVKYIYDHTAIGEKMGDAGPAWVTSANARKYTVKPEPADNSVGIMAPGHVYWVGSVKKNKDDYNMTNIKQANWPNNPSSGVYSTNTGNKSIKIGVKFKGENTWHTSYGFITKVNGSSVKWK
jgi:hypothetical protein